MVADDYDRYRLPYPHEVVDAVIALSKLHSGSCALEIGCGSGQLSVPLARLGVNLIAVELGPRLATLARRHLKPFPHARVEVSAFERWPAPTHTFDAVVSASAFHWIDPDIRFTKSAALIHPDGCLTILHVHHVSGGTQGFFADTQPIYVKWGLSDDLSFQPSTPETIPTLYPELDHLPEFDSVERRRYEVPRRHSTAAYTGWLKTDSLVNSLGDESRCGFLDDMERLIDAKYDGEVIRNYVYDIITARRAS
jgi:SAM-dependent methyltransferase